MITVPVRVTPWHIQNGRPGRCTECPVALAITDAIPGTPASICPVNTALDIDGHRVILRTPRRAASWIRAFDAGYPVAPFEFTLRIQQPGTPGTPGRQETA